MITAIVAHYIACINNALIKEEISQFNIISPDILDSTGAGM